MKKLLLPLGWLFFIACTNNVDKQATPVDSSAGGTVVTDELPEAEELGPITKVFTNVDSTFNTGSFYPSGVDSVPSTQSYQVDSGSLRAFAPVLIYNTDSSLAIDPYSYNYIIHQQQGQQKVSEAGPDVEVALIDLKNNTRRRLWYSGPAAAILDAKWKNKNELLLGGAEQVDTAGYQPFVLVVNITNNHIDRWQSDEMLKGPVNDVLKQRLEAHLNATRTTRAF
jgi:hypothetical protein